MIMAEGRGKNDFRFITLALLKSHVVYNVTFILNE